MVKQTSKKKSIRRKLTAVAVGTVLLVAGTIGVVRRTVNPGEKVVAVIDGDTFTISNKENIRLSSLNAPENNFCFGKEAKDALSKEILGKTVILKDLKYAQYGRVMALVYVDGTLVNELLIKNGFAYRIADSSTESEALSKASDFAKENRIGIYSDKCYQVKPPNSKCVIKGNITSPDGKYIYTMPGCVHYDETIVQKYKGEDWYCTEKEAKAAGYSKSPNCK